MPAQPGQTLSHYRLVEKIGQGGMGVVWKAVDTALDREVAIKILPEALKQAPERLGRFEHEAKLLASLNHPNIADVDSSDPLFSRDGKRISGTYGGQGVSIYELDPALFDPAQAPTPILPTLSVEGFYADSWSPDGRHVGVSTRSPLGTDAETVHSLETGKTTLLHRPDGGYFFSLLLGTDFIDDRRVLLWDRNLSTAFVADVETEENCEVAGILGPAELLFADGGNRLYLCREIRDADIWRLELSE